MGSGCRSSAERQGTQPGAGFGRAVPEGSGSDAPKHARAFHPAFEGAHRARSWLWIVARRSVGGRPREINASQKMNLPLGKENPHKGNSGEVAERPNV